MNLWLLKTTDDTTSECTQNCATVDSVHLKIKNGW